MLRILSFDLIKNQSYCIAIGYCHDNVVRNTLCSKNVWRSEY